MNRSYVVIISAAGDTLLHAVARIGNEAATLFLVQRDANVNTANHRVRLPRSFISQSHCVHTPESIILSVHDFDSCFCQCGL